MYSEKNPFGAAVNQPNQNIENKQKKSTPETPAVPSNDPARRWHGELHRFSAAPIDEDSAEEVREEVCAHYQIPLEHVVIAPEQRKEKREVRAFTILEHRSDPHKKYYADGHHPHAILLNMILDKFSKPNIADESRIETARREEITDDFFDNWIIKKGFIDPYVDNFRQFKETHDLLKKIMVSESRINGLTPEEAEALQNNPEASIPNWIRSG
jgi:hypothetical protein